MNPTKPDYEAWKSEILARMDTSKTVLAIIDMQRDFCSPDGALAALGSDVSTSREVADRIDEFLPKVREWLSSVTFFRLVYDPQFMSEAQKERLIRNGRPIICRPDDPGSDLVLAPQPQDPVFVKHRYSAFSNEDFCSMLEKHRISTVVVAGVDTHICIEGTVRDGYDLGYRMIVLSDLVGTRRSELSRHDYSLGLCDKYFGLSIESSRLLEVCAMNRRRQLLSLV